LRYLSVEKKHFHDSKIIDLKRVILREEQGKTAKIFVGGVGSGVNEEDFKNFFEHYDMVIDAQLVIDKNIGQPR
jgi:RNA recognition motif-containing protein